MKIKKIRLLKGFLILFFIFNCKIKIFAKTDSLIEKKKVAVFDMAANNVPGYYGNIVRNSLEIALFNSDKFQLLDRQQVEEISKKLNISSQSNNNPSDMVRLGKRLQADFIINGSIDKLDDYKITLRVISISGGSIITAYSRFFSKANDVDYAVERLNEKIVRDIHKYIKDGRVRSRFFEHNNMYLGVRGNYIYPINELESIINPGPGVTFFTEFEHVIWDYTYLGVEFSYYKFTGEKNSKDTLTFVPILLNSGYRWHFFKKFYLKPEISMGINMVSTTHGEGDGFTIEENSEEHAVELMLRSSCYFGVVPTYDFNIEWGFSYGSVFESDGNITFFNISLGALYNF